MLTRHFFVLAAALILFFISNHSQAAPSRKPNVIFLLADDLGYGDVGCYGQKKIRTPNVDRMANEGMKFTQHYSGSPVCAPSRSVLMTGQHTGHTFIRDNGEVHPEGQTSFPENAVTLAKLLKKSGYVTGAFGKWGLGGPNSSGRPLNQGFDRFYGYNSQRVAHNLYPTYLWDDEQRVSLDNSELGYNQKLPEGVDAKDPKNYERFSGKDYAPDLYTEQALKFVRDNKNRPFFLYYPTVVPHLALQVPQDSLDEYEGQFDDKPYPGGRGYLPQRTPHAAYAAMITRMDREVGRLMALVTELGLDENTIFVFTSDNGPAPQGMGGSDREFFDSNGPLREEKGTIYEGGIRVPMIVRWKGRIQPNTVSERVTGFEDWMPTLLELIGDKKNTPKNIDGISFAPVLFGKKLPERPFLYREFPSYTGQQSIRIGDWKGLRRNMKPKNNSKPNMRLELYNLKTDIGETKDVASEHPEIIAKMEKLMRRQHLPSKEFPFPALDNLAVK